MRIGKNQFQLFLMKLQRMWAKSKGGQYRNLKNLDSDGSSHFFLKEYYLVSFSASKLLVSLMNWNLKDTS